MTSIPEIAHLREQLAERELRVEQLEEQLMQSSRRMDDFLATVAHELRNPLAPARNALHILRVLDPAAPEASQAYDIIERQVEQMTRIVDDMLDISRMSRGQIVLNSEHIDLASVVEAAVESSESLIASRDLNVEVSLPLQAIMLDADFGRLAQALGNLIDNAARHSSHGGNVAVSAQLNGDKVMVSVRDDGAGMSDEQLRHVFEMRPYGVSNIEAPAGLGVGLALAKQLLSLHNAEVAAFSDGMGLGSEFVVQLPVVGVEELDAAITDVDLFEGSNDLASSPVRVLLAEDDEDSALSLALLLEHYGCTTRVVHDGLTALRVGAEFHPQVVLLDIGMPGIDGWETCRRMRREEWGQRALAIALTGWDQDEDRQRTMEAGFDHHIVKPVRVASLLDLFAGRATVSANQ